MCIFYPVIDVSIRFTPLLGFVLNASTKVYIYFVLLFCFKMEFCCRFNVRKHEVFLDYMGTPQWGPHEDNIT